MELAAIRVRADAGGSELDFCEKAGRIRAGSREAMIDAAYDGWRADMLANKTTVISAATGVDVVALSVKARAGRVAAGQVEAEGVVLRDGNPRSADPLQRGWSLRFMSPDAVRGFVRPGTRQMDAGRRQGSILRTH